MRKRASATRNVILTLGLIALVGVAIVLVPYVRHTALIMPPEPPEIIAKRHAPENAYFILMDALKLLPEKPGPLSAPAEDNPQLLQHYRPRKNSLGRLLDIGRPDDDPEFMDYLKRCEPAVAKAREALQRPYCLLPIDWPTDMEAFASENGGPDIKLRSLGRTCVELGLLKLRSGGDAADALAYLLDVVRLGIMLRADGKDTMVADGIQVYALARMFDAVPAAPENVLREVADEIAILHQEVKPPVANLQFFFRAIDNATRYSPRTGEHRDRMESEINFSLAMRGARRRLSRDRDSLLQAIALPYPEYMTWKESHPEMSGPHDLQVSFSDSPAEKGRHRERFEQHGGHHWPFFIPQEVGGLVQNKAALDVHYAGAQIMVVLEIYRKVHNEFPAALDALVPDYVKTMPLNAYSGAPLIYRRLDGDYLLYSVGVNQKDDGGDQPLPGARSKRGDDLVIHGPRAEDQS